MIDLDALVRFEEPFTHWVGRSVSRERVIDINAQWPSREDERWVHEQGKFSRKSAIQFPRVLCPAAQALAAHAYSRPFCAELSDLVGIQLEPDPWFTDGPMKPLLGGGLHEIHSGGLLKMHVDFNRHPSGMVRCLNMLIYLNEYWMPEWGGALELSGEKSIFPHAGVTVIFQTTPQSWHGHPEPLACPEGITRRSLALYYYTRVGEEDRPTTVYQK